MTDKTDNGLRGPGERDDPTEDSSIVAELADDFVSTGHVLPAPDGSPGGDLRYTATAGRVVLREESHTEGTSDGVKPTAEIFMVSYVADPPEGAYSAAPSPRPVTFAFNGGPGSSSVWLHMGLLGQRRVLMGDAGDLAPPPYGLADNAESLLRHSDLVFIDPVSTGFSRAIKGGKPQDFHGYAPDIDSVGEVIRLWTTRNKRWMSPKYLCGESYGTMRAAGLALHLARRYGMYLNGLILISAFLDGGSVEFAPGNDEPYICYLPTYAAIAHYHGKHGERTLAEVLEEAEHYAERDYRWALARGARLTPDERAEAVRRVAALTGLTEDYVDRVNLRPEHIRFLTEVLRDRRLVAGRIDGRFTGWDTDYGRETWTSDPSIDAITGPYAAALNHYVRAELGYQSDLPYETLTSRVQPWSYKDFEAVNVQVVDKLAEAMRVNPAMRVHVSCGYHDAATPYFAAEHDIAHLAIPQELATRIEFAYFEAGHMMYMHEESRTRQSELIKRFVANP